MSNLNIEQLTLSDQPNQTLVIQQLKGEVTEPNRAELTDAIVSKITMESAVEMVSQLLTAQDEQPNDTLIRIDRQLGKMEVFCGIHKSLGRKIFNAEIAYHPLYEALELNSGKTYSPDEAYQKLKRYGAFATDKSFLGTLTQLRRVNVKAEVLYIDERENDGSKLQTQKVSTTEHTLPKALQLKMPIFVGGDDVILNITVVLHVAGGVRIELEDLNVYKLEEESRKDLIAKAINPLYEELPEQFRPLIAYA